MQEEACVGIRLDVKWLLKLSDLNENVGLSHF